VIFIDTSVWIQYLSNGEPRLVNRFNQILEADQVALSVMVWLELLSGASHNELTRLRRVLSALPRFYPADKTWTRLESWVERAVKSGQRFSAMDLLIGSIAVDQNAKIWSLDSDFKRMEKLGFIELF